MLCGVMNFQFQATLKSIELHRVFVSSCCPWPSPFLPPKVAGAHPRDVQRCCRPGYDYRAEAKNGKRKEKKREAEKQKQSFLINPFRPVETKSWERTWKNWPNWYIQTHLKTHFSEFLPGLVFLTFWIIVVLLVWFSALFSDVSDLSDILLCL